MITPVCPTTKEKYRTWRFQPVLTDSFGWQVWDSQKLDYILSKGYERSEDAARMRASAMQAHHAAKITLEAQGASA